MTNDKVTRIAPSDISFTANCGHCLWHKYHTGWKNESIFPSVFSLLDINQKNYFNPLGVKEISKDLPEGIVDQKIADKFITSKVFYDNKDRPFRIGGKADLILIFDEGGYGVIDNKTSKVRDNQDSYFYQLECYAQILENPDEETAEKLVELGVKTFDDIAYMDDKDLEDATGLDHEKAQELKSSASDAALIEAMGEFSAEEDELASLTGLGFSEDDIETLKSNKLKTMDDVAELAVDELIDIVPMDEKKAADIIMKARESWFEE